MNEFCQSSANHRDSIPDRRASSQGLAAVQYFGPLNVRLGSIASDRDVHHAPGVSGSPQERTLTERAPRTPSLHSLRHKSLLWKPVLIRVEHQPDSAAHCNAGVGANPLSLIWCGAIVDLGNADIAQAMFSAATARMTAVVMILLISLAPVSDRLHAEYSRIMCGGM